ncbi:MAG: group 1 truncated hemoglobin [Gammaproteobacteria bacterium]|nr:group 1 truncated hemoglobin [Gammaproteobacteria bacterium]
MKAKLFYEIGGLEIIQKVHEVFYDKVYAHEWLKKYFENHNRLLIENQQTAFMSEKFGSKVSYVGRPPRYAHLHMFITDELFEVRHALLKEALIEVGLRQDHIARWLNIDAAFKHHITNDSLELFNVTHTFHKKINIPKPDFL